ncbi:MAG: hypothetical protein OXI50_06590 [Gammaproteobacteria bacterium]|nr:hypothetical protein [Gammaproteobacteria bacterium]
MARFSFSVELSEAGAERRRDAVVAALELIRAKCRSGGPDPLQATKHLSEMADDIEAALQPSKQAP